jgi:NADP-dependent 3-hydroxy acid dehydrogenase YdfG
MVGFFVIKKFYFMKKIFITGASSGIGLAIAKEYAAHFAQGVVLGLVGRKFDALQQLADTLKSDYNASCAIYALDVRDPIALRYG